MRLRRSRRGAEAELRPVFGHLLPGCVTKGKSKPFCILRAPAPSPVGIFAHMHLGRRYLTSTAGPSRGCFVRPAAELGLFETMPNTMVTPR